ncbi:MAG: hypothetical protein IKT61_01395 [Clostridia bacterium]|nr:hypothetical protein [Clostridia bacterium]
MSECKNCKKTLTSDEIGLTKKLINRGSTEFYCMDCLADVFKCDKSLLEKKIEQFRKQGCVLFV